MFDSLIGRKPEIIDFSRLKKFALGIPLVYYNGQLCIIFEVRSQLLTHQPGEVCLPGGAVEPGEDFALAAVRETSEELEISPDQIELIAPMDIYISPTGQYITPYLLFLKAYQGTYNLSEVAEIFYVPVKFFWENKPDIYENYIYTKPAKNLPIEKIPHRRKYPWRSGSSSVYFYPEFQGHLIWGLTAKIMCSAAEIMKNAEYRDTI